MARVSEPAASDRSQASDKDAEICQVGESICNLPLELFQMEDLSKILSIGTWNHCLTEEERERLCSFLPSMDQESYKRTLKELLGGSNVNFGSPLAALLQQLKAGLFSPEVSKYQEVLRFLQRKEYYHHLHQYHNGMMKSFVEMQNIWLNHPEADMDKRLELWDAWKLSSGQVTYHSEGVLPGKAYSIGSSKGKGLLNPRREREVSELHMMREESAELTLGAVKGVLHMEQKGGFSRYPSSQLGAEEEAFEHNKIKKREFLLVKHGNNVDFNPMIGDNVGKEKLIGKNMLEKNNSLSGWKVKGGDENSSPESEMEISKEEPSMVLNSSQVTTKHSSDSKFQQVEMLNNQSEEESSEDSQAERSSKNYNYREGKVWFSDLHAEGQETPLWKSEEPSSKRLKRDNQEIQEETSSGAFNVSMLDNTSCQTPKKSARHLVPSSALNFPFSILHLLSAVRASLIAPSHLESCSLQQDGLPAFTFKEVVGRVHANPGDLRILSAREPLEGLVRGVLKVLSSKTTQPVIKGWKPFVARNKVARGWCWVGPLPAAPVSIGVKEVETGAEAWCVSQKMLYKIQDAFATWLKNAQETLQLLGELGVPPLPPVPFALDKKERFRDLRAQKSLITINPTSDEMRAYFRREESVRYLIPDIAFFYTTACGQKSAVAPLKRFGGKSNAKARDHFMLKSDRPSHVTILCLVRDAAARLPHSTGTRADVCILLRDSQYIVEDVSDTQLSQVVSGALDRLHYERDPCVQYDADRKLWVYLHADREEEDFEDDGTSSTKRWKRGKKDGGDSSEFSSAQEHGPSCRENQDPPTTKVDFSSSPTCFVGSGDFYSTSDTPELLYNHHSSSLASTPMIVSGYPGQVRDDSVPPFIELPPSIQPSCANMQSHPMGWEMYRQQWDQDTDFQSHNNPPEENYRSIGGAPLHT